MRLLILKRLFFIPLTLIWGALFFTQVVSGQAYRQQAERNRTRLIHLPAARGSILDRHGVALVEDQMRFELALLPQELKDPSLLWARLHPMVGVDPEVLAQRYRRRWEAPFLPVPLIQDLPLMTAFHLEEERGSLPGVFLRPVPRRHYPLGPALGPVTGYVGLIAPEELTKLTPYGYSFRDWVGKDGLEKMYDRILRGKDGGLQVEVDHRGRMVRQLGYRAPKKGKAITVSLDGRLQAFCYRLLHERPDPGAILVMDCKTGEILALVSTPSFDPGAFVDSARQEEVRWILHGRGRPLFNRAIRAEVPPGSTFKVAVAYQALKEKKIGPYTAFACPGSFRLGKANFRCWRQEGHGYQTVKEALEHSCNVFFYQTGRRLGVTGLIEGCGLFGLGRFSGIDLPREAKGLIPEPSWMRATFHQAWQEGDTVSFSIGQGPLTTTPLQMLLLITAVAMEGRVPPPHLLLSVEGEEKIPSRKISPLALDKRICFEIKQALEQVVASATGTGRLANVPGIRAAGKTGTAQTSRGDPHAWFLGYAPADRPALSFAVFLEHGGKGGEQAALVARDLLVYFKELGLL